MAWQANYTNYTKWQAFTELDKELGLRLQLKKIKSDGKQLEDCFYKHLEFGTGGMRSELGPGTELEPSSWIN